MQRSLKGKNRLIISILDEKEMIVKMPGTGLEPV